MSKVIKQILQERDAEIETGEVPASSSLRVVPSPEPTIERFELDRAEAAPASHAPEPARSDLFDRPIRELLRDQRSALARSDEERAERRRERLEATLKQARRQSLVPYLLVLIACAAGAGLYLRIYRPPAVVVIAAPPSEAIVEPKPVDPALVAGNAEVVALYRSLKLKEAQRRADELLAKHRGSAELYVNAAMVRKALGRRVLARWDLEAALRLEPTNATALNNMGMLELEQRRLSVALYHFEAALKSEPGHVSARLNYARALEQSGRWTEAAREYLSVAAVFQNDPIFAGLLRKRIAKLQEGK